MADLTFVDQHNMVAYLERTDGNAEFYQIVDFLTTSLIHYALIVSPTIYASYIEQFWATSKSKTVNDVKQIYAIVDGKTVVISELSVRSDFYFNDEDGITCLSNDEIFVNLALMRNLDPTSKKFLMYLRFLQLFLNNQIDLAEPFNDVYVTPVHTKKVFTNMKRQNKDFSGTVTPLFASMLVPQVVEGEDEDDRVVRTATTATSLEAEQESGNINKTRSTKTLNEPSPQGTGSELNTSGSGENSMEHQDDLMDFVPPTPHHSPLSGGHTPGSDEGDIDDNRDDIDDMVDEAMENIEGNTVSTAGVVNTTTGASAASASVTTTGVSICTAEPRTPPTTITTVFEDEDLTIAQTLVKMRSEKAKEKRVAFRDVEESARPTKILPTIDPKDKGKGIILQSEEQEQFTIKEKSRMLVEIIAERKGVMMISKKLFDNAYKQVNSFIPIDSEVIKDSGKKDDSSSKQAGSRKKRAGSKLKPKSPKKLKVIKEQESTEDEQEKEERILCLKIV
nr:hypothetical protein [Tanacetum cinerariifolium]